MVFLSENGDVALVDAYPALPTPIRVRLGLHGTWDDVWALGILALEMATGKRLASDWSGSTRADRHEGDEGDDEGAQAEAEAEVEAEAELANEVGRMWRFLEETTPPLPALRDFIRACIDPDAGTDADADADADTDPRRERERERERASGTGSRSSRWTGLRPRTKRERKDRLLALSEHELFFGAAGLLGMLPPSQLVAQVEACGMVLARDATPCDKMEDYEPDIETDPGILGLPGYNPHAHPDHPNPPFPAPPAARPPADAPDHASTRRQLHPGSSPPAKHGATDVTAAVDELVSGQQEVTRAFGPVFAAMQNGAREVLRASRSRISDASLYEWYDQVGGYLSTMEAEMPGALDLFTATVIRCLGREMRASTRTSTGTSNTTATTATGGGGGGRRRGGVSGEADMGPGLKAAGTGFDHAKVQGPGMDSIERLVAPLTEEALLEVGTEMVRKAGGVAQSVAALGVLGEFILREWGGTELASLEDETLQR